MDLNPQNMEMLIKTDTPFPSLLAGVLALGLYVMCTAVQAADEVPKVNKPVEEKTQICFSKLSWGMPQEAVKRSLNEAGYNVPQLRDPEMRVPNDVVISDGSLVGKRAEITCVFGVEELRDAGLQKVEIKLMGDAADANRTYQELRVLLAKKYGPPANSIARQDLKPGLPSFQAKWRTPRAFTDTMKVETFALELVIEPDAGVKLYYYGPKWPDVMKLRAKNSTKDL